MPNSVSEILEQHEYILLHIGHSAHIYFNIVYWILCLLATFTSLVNSLVFVNKNLKDQTYTFLLFQSINDIFYVAFVGTSTFIANFDPRTHVANIFRIVFYDYAASSLAIINILMELLLTLQRLFILLNKPFLHKNMIYLFLAVYVLGFVLYIPSLFFKNTVSYSLANVTNGSSVFVDILEESVFAKSRLGSILPTILSMFRLSIPTFVIFPLSIMVIYEFNKLMSKKKSLLIKNFKIGNWLFKIIVINKPEKSG